MTAAGEAAAQRGGEGPSGAVSAKVSPPPAVPGALGAGGLWLLVFVAALALYVLTANRGVQWQDSGWQQYRIVTGQIGHPYGLALTHPLQFLLGWLAIRALPMLEPAFAITLVSALAGAVAVAGVAALVRLLTGRVGPAVLAAVALLFAHTFWRHATITESYTIVAALLTLEWLCIAQCVA